MNNIQSVFSDREREREKKQRKKMNSNNSYLSAMLRKKKHTCGYLVQNVSK